MDGLNFHSFVLISGGAYDRKEDITLQHLDKGGFSMFPKDKMKNIDTQSGDYKDKLPDFNYEENDDLFNN